MLWWLPSQSLFISEAGACSPMQMVVQKVCRMIADDVPRVSVRVIGTSMVLDKYKVEQFFVIGFVPWPY